LLLVTCFLVQLTSRPLGFARSVLNTVITNARATVKNYMSLNYDWLRFSGSVQEDDIIATLETWHSCTSRKFFSRWVDSRHAPADLLIYSN
jgi:hypothetical protein